MADWQPIETAPRDGTAILVNAPDLEAECTIAFYYFDHPHSIWDGKAFGPHVTMPTHWMPLPHPPVPA